MPRAVSAQIRVPGPVYEVETLWYDTSRWPTWVDGLGHIHAVKDPWPDRGGRVIWDSTPAGRGRVYERVERYEPRSGQVAEVEDETLGGRQEISFVADGDDVVVTLALAYKPRSRSPLMPVIDLLFGRRAMATSLQQTLRRFAIELDDERRTRAGA